MIESGKNTFGESATTEWKCYHALSFSFNVIGPLKDQVYGQVYFYKTHNLSTSAQYLHRKNFPSQPPSSKTSYLKATLIHLQSHQAMPRLLTKAKRAELHIKRSQEEAKIAQAIHDLHSGAISLIWKALLHHNVPHTTLWKCQKGIKLHQDAHKHHQLLLESQEVSLLHHIKATAAQGFPITIRELINHAAAFHKENQYNPDSIISRKWAQGFIHCHLMLLPCFSRVLDHSRAKVSNSTIINQHFDLLQSTIMNHDIPIHHIYNMDETGFVFGWAQSQKVLVYKPKKVSTIFRMQPGQ